MQRLVMNLDPAIALGQAAQEYATDPAVICGAQSISFAELQRRAFRVANALRERRVKPGDRVATLGPHTDGNG